jgi:hypothetical protein
MQFSSTLHVELYNSLHMKYWFEHHKKETARIDGLLILTWVSKNRMGMELTELILLRIGSCGDGNELSRSI